MKDDIISSLINVLKKEYKYHQKLCETARAKKEVIIENKIKDLSEIIEKEKVLLSDLNELEDNRSQYLDLISTEYNLESNPPQYNILKKELDSSQKNELKDIREKLLKVIEELQSINQENKILLEEAIKLNNFSFELIANSLEPENNIYDKNTTKKDKKVKNIIDRKA